VSWSLGRTYSAQGSTTDVCSSGKPGPCILERSTDERTTYARFSLHVFGPKSTTFRGTVVFSYLNDPDPSRYKTIVNLTSNNQDVHHHTFNRVTTVPVNTLLGFILRSWLASATGSWIIRLPSVLNNCR